ncbi:ParB/RepB/Spo0J family partition protein [Vibrio fluvialis]|uniref:ParB/RepB/Spo0J family partition protein n=1 Tax=Vibrio fluvialis TaxID=676 RepID=UPI0013023BD2|nr:ParB/RepB/Spo0J family partition protein [Vibrio fluvialis]
MTTVNTSLLVALTNIARDPKQPRKSFDAATIRDLAVSIAAQGIIQPIIVRDNPNKAGHYYVVAGERRFRAAKKAGLVEVPCLVNADIGDNLRAIQLTENFHREDLTLIEIAEGVESHINDIVKATGKKKVTNKDLCKTFGNSETYWSRVRKLAKSPEVLKEALRKKSITNINVASDLTTLFELSESAFNDVWADLTNGNISGNLENYISMQVRMTKQIAQYGFVLPLPNEHGVYAEDEPGIKQKNFDAEDLQASVQVLQVEKDSWALSARCSVLNGYSGSGISVPSREKLTSECAAFAEGLIDVGHTAISQIQYMSTNGSDGVLRRLFGPTTKQFFMWLNEQLQEVGSEVRFDMPKRPTRTVTEQKTEPRIESEDKNITQNEDVPIDAQVAEDHQLSEDNTSELQETMAEDIAVLQSELKTVIAANEESPSVDMKNFEVPEALVPLLSRIVGYYIAVSHSMGEQTGFAQVEKMVKELTGEVKRTH